MTTEAGTRLAAAAIAAAEHGWSVFPCRQGDKRPAIERWEERASANPAAVAEAWGQRWSRANIGVACGPSRLVVIDLDTAAHGGSQPENWAGESGVRDGRDVLAVLAERASQPWPGTYSVTTPSGGLHLYFAAIPGREIRNSAGKIGPMVDVRAAGGYVVAAGSIVGGRAYEVADGSEPVPLPGWLADLVNPPRALAPHVDHLPAPLARPAGSRYGEAALRRELEAVLTAPAGSRNVSLHRAAFCLGQLVAAGALGGPRVEELLVRAGEQAGLPASEARRTVASGMRAGTDHPRGGVA